MKLAPSPPTPLELTLTRSVVPFRRSRTNTSSRPFMSPGTMLSVSDTNKTNRPSADIHPPPPSTGLSSDVRLTSSTPSPVAASACDAPPAARPIRSEQDDPPVGRHPPASTIDRLVVGRETHKLDPIARGGQRLRCPAGGQTDQIGTRRPARRPTSPRLHHRPACRRT